MRGSRVACGGVEEAWMVVGMGGPCAWRGLDHDGCAGRAREHGGGCGRQVVSVADSTSSF
jgi:hypothetical protein